MAGLGDFDTRSVDTSTERTEFTPIPKGRYRAEIVEVQWKDAKSGGRYLEIRYYISTVNRYLWDRLNLYNANEKAVEIAVKRLAQMRAATGRDGGQDGEGFLDCQVHLEVGVRANKEMGREENVIWGVSAPEVARSQGQMIKPQREPAKFRTAANQQPQPARQWGKIQPARGPVADDMPF
jgi:hypothetical protein